MRALVTGVAGFIGSHLAERLIEDGATVTGVDSLTNHYDPVLKRRNLAGLMGSPAFRFVEGDLTTLNLAELVESVDVVFHFAARAGVRGGFGSDFEHYLRDNALATQRVLEAARRGAAGRVVFASSSSVYGATARLPTPETERLRPLSPYGITKVAAEELCRLYWQSFGVPVVRLRYFTVYGPRPRPDMAFSRFIDAGLGRRPVPVHGDGRQSRDFTFVADAVDATVRAAEYGAPGAVYNIAGGEPVTVLDVVSLIGSLLGEPLTLEYRDPGQPEPRRTFADTSAAKRELGFRPATALRGGLELQIEHQRALHMGMTPAHEAAG